MFEKEAEEYIKTNNLEWELECHRTSPIGEVEQAFQKGAEFGYNKGKEEVKHDLMMKLKDEGIVKPLKDSIFRNERLSSQEQQELCAWIECAMGFGENLDECAKELEEAKELIEKLLNAFASNDFFTKEELDAMAEAEEFLGGKL